MAFRRAALILCTALAAPFVGAGALYADPSTRLTSFGDFSGDATQLGFDNLGLSNGGDITGLDGVTLTLSNGSPARYYEDTFARESGIGDVGSVSNFWGFVRPYPDVGIAFASPVHRVGFEARVNAADELHVTLVSAGVTVDEFVVPSRGSDALYFYGFENAAAFDTVRLDGVEHATGAFTFDNLTFESVGVTQPPDDPGPDPEPDPDPQPDPDPDPQPEPATLACDGFEAFPPNRPGHSHHTLPLRVLLAKLVDADGNELSNRDMSVAPKLKVLHMPEDGGSAVDVTDEVTWHAPSFGFAGGRLQSWFVWTLPWQMREDGTYLATMESGDPAAYTLDPSCADWTLVDRHPRRVSRDKNKGRGRH